jgi:catechol 2,3-dioxygenase-like lactoylglutathione lyase family enzyme
MGALSDAKATTALGVKDMDEAKEFYEGKLGFSGGREIDDGGVNYACGSGTEIHVYPSPNAGKNETTAVAFEVDDFEGTVDELIGNGVTFEQYDQEGLKTDEKGIASFEGDTKVAFVKDPSGNIIAVSNG